MKIAIYPGTFDPLTMGHLDLIKRAAKLFDKVIVLVSVNASKKSIFEPEERVDLIKEAVKDIENTEVDYNEGLTVKYAEKHGVNILVRGVRAFSDFEYELQMALMNRKLNNEIETVFLMPKNEYSYISSTIVKGITDFGGNITEFVPPNVKKALNEKKLKN